MDIAKIRKKAREKERKDAGQPPRQPDEADLAKMDGGTEAPPVETVQVFPEAAEKRSSVAEEKVVPPPGGEYLRGEPEEKNEAEPSPEAGKEAENVVELLTFSLLTEEFGFRVSDVEEIIRHQPITRVPTMPDYVIGITSLRGKIMPVIDLKTRIVLMGVRGEDAQSQTVNPDGKKKILIIRGPKGPIGVTVDKVLEVVRVPQGKVLEPPGHLMEEERKFVDGVVIHNKRFVSIVRCEEALKIDAT